MNPSILEQTFSYWRHVCQIKEPIIQIYKDHINIYQHREANGKKACDIKLGRQAFEFKIHD